MAAASSQQILWNPCLGDVTRESNSKHLIATWFCEWQRPLRRFIAGRRMIPPWDLDDLAQEVFFRVIRYNRTELIEQPQAYLFKMAVNVATEWSARSRNASARELAWFDGNSSEGPTEGELNRLEDEDEIERALLCLSSRERDVLRLQFYQDLSHAQIADRLGVTERVVKRALSKGYRRLRLKLVSPHT